MNEKENAEIAFDVLERHYDQLLEEIKTKPDLDEIKALYQRIESSEIKMKELEIIENYQKRLSEMKGNLLNYLKPSKELPSAPGATQKLGETEVIVEPEELPLTPEEIQRMGGTEVKVEAFGEEKTSDAVVSPEQPMLEKVENPGLKYVNAAIEYAETGLLDEEKNPRKGDFGVLDERMQLLKDFGRGDYIVGGVSTVEDGKDRQEEAKKVVKSFLSMGESEAEDSDKSKQYRFILNAGQDLLSMFTDDVHHNVQYQDTNLDPFGTEPLKVKWSKNDEEEVILELEYNFRVMNTAGGMDAKQIACNQSGQVELYELGEAPKEGPPLVRYHYKARLVPTEKGAKLETISYSVEINPGLSHSQKFTYPASNVFTEMQNVINAPFSVDSTERLKKAIADVKNSPAYIFVKDSGGGTKEEKKAVAMIERLDKMLQACENNKSKILAPILKRALEGQVKRMKESDDFKIGIMRLKAKSEPNKSAQFKEESIKPNTAELKEMLKRLSYPKEILDLSSSDQGHQNFKQLIEFIKRSDEYEKYKIGGEIDPDLSKAFKAIDECEKLLNKAIKAEKIPIAWERSNRKLKELLERKTEVFKEASKDQESRAQMRLSNEELSLMKDFVQRVERMMNPVPGPTSIAFSGDGKKPLEDRLGEVKSLIAKINPKGKVPGRELSVNKEDEARLKSSISALSKAIETDLNGALEFLSQGASYCTIETGQNILRNKIDMIKISPEYLEYQNQKQEGKHEGNPNHDLFKAVDECEKLLVKAIKTQKVPLVSMANNNKLKKFFQENSKKFELQVQEAPSNRKSASN